MKKLEESLFSQKSWNIENMIAYGFQKRKDTYVLETSFLKGDFKAILSVTNDGKCTSKVIDKMIQEEYYQLYQEDATGTYVNMVRAAYLSLLKDIATACCSDVLFTSRQANRITQKIQEHFHVKPDFPWKESSRNQSYGVFRHVSSQKWFALIMDIKKGQLDKDKNNEPIDVINLKIQPDQGPALHQITGIYPAYHMNHKNWISVVLDESLADEKIMALLHTSYELTK